MFPLKKYLLQKLKYLIYHSNMRYKSSLFIIIICTLNTTPASAAPFDGGYVGVQAGYEHFNVKNDFSQANEVAYGANDIDKFHASGGSGGVYAGYGKQFYGIYLGIEAEGSLGREKFSREDNSFGQFLKVYYKNSYGASLRAGVLPTDNILIYTRFGAVITESEYTLYSPYLIQPPPPTGNPSINGVKFGFGSEAMLTDHISAKLDWSYTDYKEYKSNVNEKFTPSSNTFRAGIGYYF